MASKRHFFTKIFVVLGGILLCVGTVFFVVGMTLVNWDFDRLSNVLYEQKQYVQQDETPIERLIFDYPSACVTLTFSPEASRLSMSYPVRVNANGDEMSSIEIIEQDGTLTVSETIRFPQFLQWETKTPELTVILPERTYAELSVRAARGICATGLQASERIAFASDYGNVEVSDLSAPSIQLTADAGNVLAASVRAESVLLRSDCGNVEGKNIAAEHLLELYSKLGNVLADDVSSEGALRMESECGNCVLRGACTAKDASVEVDLGNICVDGILSASQIDLTNDCGNVEGTIAGSAQDYTIRAVTDLGNNNLRDRDGGSKTLTIHVSLGNIEILFAEEQ